MTKDHEQKMAALGLDYVRERLKITSEIIEEKEKDLVMYKDEMIRLEAIRRVMMEALK